MNTAIVYEVLDENGKSEIKAFLANKQVSDAKEALKAAKSNYTGNGSVSLQGYFDVSEEELAHDTTTSIFG